MIRRLTAGVPARALFLLGVLLVGFIVAPWFAGDYVLTVLILILYFAYTGIRARPGTS
jgi:branched-chain amino acid transport system permease protein